MDSFYMFQVHFLLTLMMKEQKNHYINSHRVHYSGILVKKKHFILHSGCDVITKAPRETIL